jgi:hypothetical protein
LKDYVFINSTPPAKFTKPETLDVLVPTLQLGFSEAFRLALYNPAVKELVKAREIQ